MKLYKLGRSDRLYGTQKLLGHNARLTGNVTILTTKVARLPPVVNPTPTPIEMKVKNDSIFT